MSDPREPSADVLARAYLTLFVGPLLVVVAIRVACVLLGGEW